MRLEYFWFLDKYDQLTIGFTNPKVELDYNVLSSVYESLIIEKRTFIGRFIFKIC